MVKVRQNQDKVFVEEFQKQLKENDGYCPCRLEKTPETKCMCQEFRKQIINGIVGSCHCGLYFTERVDSNEN